MEKTKGNKTLKSVWKMVGTEKKRTEKPKKVVPGVAEKMWSWEKKQKKPNGKEKTERVPVKVEEGRKGENQTKIPSNIGGVLAVFLNAENLKGYRHQDGWGRCGRFWGKKKKKSEGRSK